MIFNDNSSLKGTHAPFSPSKSSWLRYSDNKAIETFEKMKATEMGTRLHDWAENTIKLGIKQPRSNKTIYAYVNDAIGYRMDTEVLLYYSDRFYGTCDAISYKRKKLRIHDLKTGVIPVKMEQLEIYAALFCLEYKVKPHDIEIELRIYQNDEMFVHNPEPEHIQDIMNHIIHLDNLLTSIM